MINYASIEAVHGARSANGECKPLYSTYCFSRIPGLVRDVLSGNHSCASVQRLLPGLPPGTEQFVLFLVDGFGWTLFKRFSESFPALELLQREGVVSCLTAQFPPTTVAAITTMHTGLTPGEHGIYEWFYYEPEVDDIISPFLFSRAGEKRLHTLAADGYRPENLFPPGFLYRDLAAAGASSYVYHPAAFAGSPYDAVLTAGAKLEPFADPESGLRQLLRNLKRRERSYHYYYWGDIDAAAHQYGPYSTQAAAEAERFFSLLHRAFFEPLAPAGPGRILVAVTADHGGVPVSPRTCIELNRACPELTEIAAVNSKGRRLIPAGSPRDFFLHVKTPALDDVCQLLNSRLEGRAAAVPVRKLADEGYFGPEPRPAFFRRAADIAILSGPGESVWWFEAGRFEMKHYGHHGALMPEEMEIPFAALYL